jgi:hypothetical protein
VAIEKVSEAKANGSAWRKVRRARSRGIIVSE